MEEPQHTVIGLTGPMCAGKNLAARIFEKWGYAVVDADIVAHQALNDVQGEVIRAFSRIADEKHINLLNDDRKINRRSLGSIIFSDAALLSLHESIIYPRINYLLSQFIDTHSTEKVVINATLLYKSPILDRCTFIIFIDAWAPIRFFRALKRDSLPISHIFARFSSQKHLFAQYLKKNVDIQRVYNWGSIRALEKKLAKLLLLKKY